jgi:hypothetical protein
MKIDVEGAEHLVVAGGGGLLRSADIPLVVEYNTVAIKEAGLTPESYLNLYRELGYRVPHAQPALGLESVGDAPRDSARRRHSPALQPGYAEASTSVLRHSALATQFPITIPPSTLMA